MMEENSGSLVRQLDSSSKKTNNNLAASRPFRCSVSGWISYLVFLPASACVWVSAWKRLELALLTSPSPPARLKKINIAPNREETCETYAWDHRQYVALRIGELRIKQPTRTKKRTTVPPNAQKNIFVNQSNNPKSPTKVVIVRPHRVQNTKRV